MLQEDKWLFPSLPQIRVPVTILLHNAFWKWKVKRCPCFSNFVFSWATGLPQKVSYRKPPFSSFLQDCFSSLCASGEHMWVSQVNMKSGLWNKNLLPGNAHHTLTKKPWGHLRGQLAQFLWGPALPLSTEWMPYLDNWSGMSWKGTPVGLSN